MHIDILRGRMVRVRDEYIYIYRNSWARLAPRVRQSKRACAIDTARMHVLIIIMRE
jgi:hypothetical protein